MGGAARDKRNRAGRQGVQTKNKAAGDSCRRALSVRLSCFVALKIGQSWKHALRGVGNLPVLQKCTQNA